MGMRGPAPKPTALKRLEGNPGRRPLNEREPQPARGARPSAPKWLSEAARAEWRRVVRDLHDTGVLTTIDLAVLEGYCVSYARWRAAESVLATSPEVVESDKGNLYMNPWLGVGRTALRDMLRFAQELGMTPSARSRLQVEREQTEDDLATALFKAVGG